MASYAGDIGSSEAFELLAGDQRAVLIDVRTRAEWSYVGVPDLRPIGREPIFVEWQRFPDGHPVDDFVGQLSGMLESRAVEKDMPLLFLCRSGARSRAAATVMTEAGFNPCLNIADGFEGPLDDHQHRGHMAGWKAAGLPWVQS